ncbi:MAG: diacylglycerol/lipid kinase family protein, partial [Candidatus Zixiibacteriota bacterium]
MVDRFIAGLSENGFIVDRIRPEDPREMVNAASEARKKKPYLFVAAGGDGTVNLVARTLVGSPFRFAVFPLGKCDNFFRSHVGAPTQENALKAILGGETRSIDCGRVSKLPFFCSLGLGLLPALTDELKSKSLPRFGIGWSRLVGKVEPAITRRETPVKIDAFRFNVSPKTLSVNLTPYSVGIPLAPSARADDEQFEVTLDMSSDNAELARYLREIVKGSYNFTDQIRMYRGKDISVGSVKGRRLYLD